LYFQNIYLLYALSQAVICLSDKSIIIIWKAKKYDTVRTFPRSNKKKRRKRQNR